VTGFAPAAAGIVIALVACRNLVTRLGRRLSLASYREKSHPVRLFVRLFLPEGRPEAAGSPAVSWARGRQSR
jgi:hypothetical protein